MKLGNVTLTNSEVSWRNQYFFSTQHCLKTMSVAPGAAGSGVLPFADGHPSLARRRGFASEDATGGSGAGW